MTGRVKKRRVALPPLCTFALRLVTEAAARAAYDWIGRGDQKQGEEAAARAMRVSLNHLPIDGVIVIGDGESGVATDLYNGEQIGHPRHKPKFDIAVDPVEGISFLARGMANAMAVVAMAPRGAMFQPGPAFYMEKFVGPPEIKGKIDPALPAAEKIALLSRKLKKPVADISVFVLDKPRHRELVDQIRGAGARVVLYPAGDIAGAVMAATPGSGIDAMMGTGGTAEGMLAACAIRAMGAEFQGRIDPQLETEKRAVLAAGMDTTRWHSVDELIASDQVFFCATGITPGLLLGGVERTRTQERTETLMISGPDGERQLLTTHHHKGGA